jgi:hypothetical protein
MPSPYYAAVGCGIQIDLGTSVGDVVRGEVRVMAMPQGLRLDVGAPAFYECFDARGRAIASGALRAGSNNIDMAEHHGIVVVRIIREGAAYAQRVVLP